MYRRSAKRKALAIVALITSPLITSAVASDAIEAPNCQPHTDAEFVCGLHNPEDLVPLQGTPWIVANNVSWAHAGANESDGFGPLAAVQSDTRKSHGLFSSSQVTFALDRKTFSDCSVPPEKLDSHGLNARKLGRRDFRLYVVNHGSRESIEIFDLHADRQQLRVTWRGCVLTPSGARAESVAILPGESFAVTLLGGNGPAIWAPARGWKKLEGLGQYDHGIEASPDGQWLFLILHGSGAGAVVRTPVTGGSVETLIQTDHVLDNLRWGDDGQLYAAGFSVEGMKDCAEKRAVICDGGFVISKIDPVTLKVSEVLRTEGIKGAFGAATTAFQMGGKLWVGSWWGDRVAIIGRH